MAIFKVSRTILVSRAAFKMYSMLDVSETPHPSGISLQFRRLAAGGGLRGGLGNWRGREATLSLCPALGSRLRLAARGVELSLTDTQQKRACRRTREAVSSDPPAVRSPAESGGRPDGAAASSGSPAPCSIRLREGGGEAAPG